MRRAAARRSIPLKPRALFYGGLLLLPGSIVFWLLSFPGDGRWSTESSEVRDRLRADVEELAGRIGPRSPFRLEKLLEAEQFIAGRFAGLGYEVTRHPYEVDGDRVANIEVVISGSDPTLPCLVVGAHYDTVHVVTPGADDNASGVALLLELARGLTSLEPARTVRLVAFVLEEPPYFQTEKMGSLVYARGLAAAETPVELMISLESLGYYSSEPGSQNVPKSLRWFFPDIGDFVAVVGNLSSASHVSRVTELLVGCDVRVESAALPSFIAGVGWSDHWSFWQLGLPALMLTDTAPFRNRHYHEGSDTPDTLDYEVMASLSVALPTLVGELAGTAGTGVGAPVMGGLALLVTAFGMMFVGVWLRVRELKGRA